jgi:hypothetical protein
MTLRSLSGEKRLMVVFALLPCLTIDHVGFTLRVSVPSALGYDLIYNQKPSNFQDEIRPQGAVLFKIKLSSEAWVVLTDISSQPCQPRDL